MAEASKRSRNWIVVGVATVLVLGGLGTVGAVQAQNHFKDMRASMSFDGPMADRMVEYALKAVDANADQRAAIEAIVEGSRAEIGTILKGHQDTKMQFTALLAADTLDRAAFEALRQQMLETADHVSSTAFQSLLDAAELLTPEQRSKLIEQSERFRN